MSARRRRSCARCSSLTLLVLWAGRVLFASQPGDGPTSRLEPDRPVERELQGGQTHSYSVQLTGGQALDVVVAQKGIDVILEAEDPAGRLLFQRDAPIGSFGEERAVLTAGRTGSYIVRVRALREGRAAGRYEIRVHGLRQAADRDRTLDAAQRAWTEGYRLDHERTAGSARRAVSQYERSAALWGSVGEPREEAIALLGVGRVQRFLGSPRLARDAEERALELSRACRDREIEAMAGRRVAMFLISSGDPSGAIPLLERGRELARATGDPEEESSTVNRLGEAWWLLGRFQKGLDLFVEATSLTRHLRNLPTQARTSALLGLAYQELGEPQKAIPHLREAAAVWSDAHRPDEHSRALRYLALAYLSTGAHARALETLEAALEEARRVGNRESQAAALEGIGFARLALNEPESARAPLEAALDLWTRLGSVSSRATTLVNLGRCDSMLGREERATSEYTAALELARRSGDRRIEAAALSETARLDLEMGRTGEALDTSERAIALLESIRGELAAPALRRSFLSSRQDPYATAVDALLDMDRSHPDGGFRARAFQASERGRARALAEAIAEARLDLSGTPTAELRGEEEELSKRLAQLEREQARPDSDHALGEAEERWERLMGAVRLRRAMAVNYPEPASLAAIQSLLCAECALVSYGVGQDRVLTFVVTRRSLDVYRLPLTRERLVESIENYVGLISKDDRDRWREVAAGLHRSLVGPWRDRLPPGTRRLIIIPEGALHSLPFEALAPDRSTRCLVEDFAVSYVPSATVLAQLASGRVRNAAGGPASVLALASPTVPEIVGRAGGEVDGQTFDLAPLPYASLEARRVSRFGGEGSEVLLGDQASERAVRGLPPDRFGVIHFACHGVLNEEAPSRSALLLAGTGGADASDGLLRARDIYRLRLASDLVVLSACRTARGRILPGEGVEGLAQAFFQAGVGSVVASLWDVSDRHTARLMEAFYGRLAAGESKADALRGAKVDLLREETDLAPRFWAPFVLIGEPAATVPLRPVPWWRRLFG
jgi:CHAT domain-containing protein